MNPAANFAVETAPEKALIICGHPALASSVLDSFRAHGIETTLVPSFKPADAIPDLDYLVSFGWEPGLPKADRTFVFLSLKNRGDYPAIPTHFPVCYYHDFIGPDLSQSPVLEEYLGEAASAKRLTIPGDGLAEYHVLHSQDLLVGFSQFVFAPHPPSELILINPESISLLSLAYRLRSHLPYKLDIIFDENKSWGEPPLDWESIAQGQTQIGWSPDLSFEKALPQYINDYFAQPNKAVPSPPVNPPAAGRATISTPLAPKTISHDQANQKHLPQPVFIPLRSPRPKLSSLADLKAKLPRPRLPKFTRLALSSLTVALVLYLFSLIVAGTITFLTFRSLLGAGEGTLPTARQARTALPPAIYLQANLTALSYLPGVRSMPAVSAINNLFTSYLLGLRIAPTVSSLAESSKQIAEYVLADTELDIASALNLARLDIAALYEQLSLLDGSLPVEPPSVVPARYSDGYRVIKSQLGEGRRAALTSKSLLAVAPDLLGIGSRRKYAVLFQNNMELRATGGFIGSFGILSLENGKLFDLQIYDVYSADGELKGHVEPPPEIKEILGEANWFLRDSNWDPDFPTSARRAEWFLAKTISQEVQGTLAVNVNTLQDILRALGPVSLTDYQEEVSADNIFERAEYHSEINFFPGSTQKKEFIASVADSLLSRLENIEADQALALTRAVAKSIDEKNTLISVSDSLTNETLASLAWNGEIRDLPCPDFGTACLADYAMLVDSNFGVNKANYFVKRELVLDTTIDANLSVSHSLRTTYTNSSTSGAWPAGPYKNYSRLYLPAGANVSDVRVGDRTLSPDAIKITSEHGRLVAGFLVEVPLATTLTVTVDYALPGSLTSSSPAYSFYWQKQSGTAADPLTINLNYPLFLEPEIVSPKAALNTQQLQFNLSNVTDRRITAKFK